MRSFGKTQGNRLKQIRNALSLKTEEAALEANVSAQQWRKYERGEAEPKISKMIFLLEKGISIKWIMTGEGPKRLSEEKRKTENIFSGHLADWIKEKIKEEPDFFMNFAQECIIHFPEYMKWLKRKKMAEEREDSLPQRMDVS